MKLKPSSLKIILIPGHVKNRDEHNALLVGNIREYDNDKAWYLHLVILFTPRLSITRNLHWGFFV